MKAILETKAKEKPTIMSVQPWNLKDRNIDYEIDWKIINRAPAFNPITRICNLCTAEKWNIIFKPKSATLNSRQELFGHCRHMEGSLLVRPKRKRK